jgi:hypothetical protein
VRIRNLALGLEILLLLPLSAPSPAAAADDAADRAASADDFLVVDCLLPGKVRRLGRRQTYVSRRRPLRTTAIDCRIRGGEYTSYDRASYATALSVWLEEARGGSAEAEFYVAQIFEKGLGTEPDFTAAATWYEKAAEKEHSGAQTALGFLYETGLGVERDPEKALYWYRKAAGIADEMVVLDKGEYEEMVRRLDEREAEVREVEETIRSLQEGLENARRRGDESAAEVQQMEARVDGLRSDLAAKLREVEELQARVAADDAEGSPGEIDFGPYHALVIGNRRYRDLPEMPSAEADARALAELLESRYGFRVRMLLDASRYQILEAMNQLREELTDDDNLVVFYAGHSVEDPETQRGWWQPVDAAPDSRANWISDRVLSDHLEVLTAKHVLVLADAVFPSVLTRSSIPNLPTGMSPERRREQLQQMAERRTRLVLAASPDPAARSGGGSSEFTSSLLRELASNEEVLGASSLYRRLVQRRESGGNPELAPIRWARHEGGADFFFVPATPAG